MTLHMSHPTFPLIHTGHLDCSPTVGHTITRCQWSSGKHGTRRMPYNAPASAESWGLFQNPLWKSWSKCFPLLKKQPNQTLPRCKGSCHACSHDLHRSVVCQISMYWETVSFMSMCFTMSMVPKERQTWEHQHRRSHWGCCDPKGMRASRGFPGYRSSHLLAEATTKLILLKSTLS